MFDLYLTHAVSASSRVFEFGSRRDRVYVCVLTNNSVTVLLTVLAVSLSNTLRVYIIYIHTVRQSIS